MGGAGGASGPLWPRSSSCHAASESLAWFAAVAILAMALMSWTAGGRRPSEPLQRSGASPISGAATAASLADNRCVRAPGPDDPDGLEDAYMESFRSFYTFYLIDRFGVSIQASQMMLFIFFIAPPWRPYRRSVGDRIGRYRVIWISMLGPLPHPDAALCRSSSGRGLTIIINLIMASAFASIMIYAMDLVPKRIGLIGGLFYGLNFGSAASRPRFSVGSPTASASSGLLGCARFCRSSGFSPGSCRASRSVPTLIDEPPIAKARGDCSIRDKHPDGPAPSLGMGDKSLKSKQRDQKQKDAAKVGVAAVAKAKQDANAHAKQPTSKTGR